jgi:acetolactate synthase-1/2/3 large subunit
MNGAELIVETAIRAGIKVCFANPGTTEMPLVLALDSRPGIKPVLGLFEGVCTGAADGYGRMLEKPAMTLLHLGPGFANGIANLHNARRARTPVVNLIGEHATWHRSADPPLAMDIRALARTVSGWQRTNKTSRALSRDMADVIEASMYGQIATLIVPNNYQSQACDGVSIASPQFKYDPIDSDRIEAAAQLLRTHRKTVLILDGRAMRRRGLNAAARIKAATGCDVLTNTYPAYVERGNGLPQVPRITHFLELGIEILSGYEAAILAGTKEPVTFFGYQGFRGRLLTESQPRVELATDRQDIVEALDSLAEALHAPSYSKITAEHPVRSHNTYGLPTGELTPEKVCLTIAALQPEGAIIVDEGITISFLYYPVSAGSAPHSLITIAGGSIGYGMPCAVGAAIACPERPVINLQADGSAMYTLQALWTEAREGLNITTLICSNRSYYILKVELLRAGVSSIGPAASSLVELDRPELNWVKLAEGMGVPAVSVDTAEALAREFHKALSEPGPHLISMILV